MTLSPRTITILQIRGMNAVHAVRAVETALGGLDGVVRAEVSLGTAEVEHDARVTPQVLVEAVKVAGFEVERWSQTSRRLPTL
ncbi:MAG TPA: heavy-metal-associated domain-containing protein [Gemmatimonadaceae bacterium]|nr:heavy-metal-associated domain-containing protein [Gemmatimonadaceae bacterium]